MTLSPEFAPMPALLGGVLIGSAASLLWVLNGRIAGISGILGGLFAPKQGDVAWRVAFLAGLLVTGAVFAWFQPAWMAPTTARSLPVTACAGVIVGLGVRYGSGCTSGHGVCGLSRFSVRSLIATLTFMGVGIATASLIQLAFGGVL